MDDLGGGWAVGRDGSHDSCRPGVWRGAFGGPLRPVVAG